MFITNSQEENELLRRLGAGDQKVLVSIYHQFAHPLFTSAYNIIKDKEVCEGIIQKIFLQLWLKRDLLQVKGSIKDYLLAATQYQVFLYIRQKSARHDLFNDLEQRLAAPSSDTTLLP